MTVLPLMVRMASMSAAMPASASGVMTAPRSCTASGKKPGATPVVCGIYPERRTQMSGLLHAFYAIGLVLTILPAILVFYGHLTLEQHYGWMLAGTFVWFVSTPVWMKPST